MKMKVLLLTAVGFFGAFASTTAQTGAESPDSPFGHGQDSLRCIENLSLFVPYVKEGSFADALLPWEAAYTECPASNRNIYIHGVKIVGWQIDNEKDAVKKQELIDKLMQVYDDYMEYFGHREDFPTPKIKEKKALEYIAKMGGKADQQLVYTWLNEAMAELKDKTNPQAIYYYFQAAHVLYQKGDMSKDQFIQEYLDAAKLMEDMLLVSSESMQAYIKQVQPTVVQTFTNSGAADCATLQEVFAPKVEENKDDLEYLKETLALFRKLRCQEEEAYFAASNYAHLIEPTAESAAGMAKQSLKKDNHADAITYFLQAAELSTDSIDQAEFLFNVAALYTQDNSYVNARKYALQSTRLNPTKGAPYVLIARLYASSGRSIFPDDAILAQTVFYAAVDKLQQALNTGDETVKEEVYSLMGNYKGNYPQKGDIFMHSDIEEGKKFTIGGWVGETVTIR